MPTRKKSPKKLSRSVRLKKYEVVYRRIKSSKTNPKKVKVKKVKVTATRTPVVRKPRSSPKVKKSRRKLTDYQKYVRSESKRSKYKNMIPTKRMKEIGASWKSRK